MGFSRWYMVQVPDTKNGVRIHLLDEAHESSV
jgi:hypothetical protein